MSDLKNPEDDDRRFANIVARMRGTSFAPEAEVCRQKAQAIASEYGLTLDQAIDKHDRHVGLSVKETLAEKEVSAKADNPQSFRSIFDGWDDYMESQEPGYKARKAREREEKQRCEAARRARIIARYGSEKLALAPCARERLILDAVRRWRIVQPAPFDRWTDSLDGWRGSAYDYAKAPTHVVGAIRLAYPLPTTIAAARNEYEYWQSRADEIEHVLVAVGDEVLDLPANIRRHIVLDLLSYQLDSKSVSDVRDRFVEFERESCSDLEKTKRAILRDLEILADSGRYPSTSVQSDTIAELIRANPSRSDRDVSRACNCSPTTVGKVRRSIGLKRDARTVQRRGQIYEMRIGERQCA